MPPGELVLRFGICQRARIQLRQQSRGLERAAPDVVRERHQRVELVLGDGHLHSALHAASETSQIGGKHLSPLWLCQRPRAVSRAAAHTVLGEVVRRVLAGVTIPALCR